MPTIVGILTYISMINITSEILKHETSLPGRVAQSVKCLATDASLTADPGVASLIPAGAIICRRLIMK